MKLLALITALALVTVAAQEFVYQEPAKGEPIVAVALPERGKVNLNPKARKVSAAELKKIAQKLGVTIQVGEQTLAEYEADQNSAIIPVATNADVAFRELILSYKISGSYSQKVNAITRALKDVGDDADADVILRAAIAKLK